MRHRSKKAVHTEWSNRVEYPGLPNPPFGTSGNACLCSSNVCFNTSTDSWMATSMWWIRPTLVHAFHSCAVLIFQSVHLVEYVFMHSKYHSYARMLVIKSPSGCPWFTLNCCVMAGPCLYQVAIRMSALSSNPRSAQIYKNCAHSHGRSMHAVACPFVLPLLCPEFRAGTYVPWRASAP